MDKITEKQSIRYKNSSCTTQEMEKLNLIEILKDCPKGMELDCTMFYNVKFDCIQEKGDNYPIKCLIETENGRNVLWFTKYGEFYTDANSKCVIFPKGKTTWEGFQRPFRDGEIVATDDGSWIGITEGGESRRFMPTYCVIKDDDKFEAYHDEKRKWVFDRLATEEEKEKLFKAIKDNGYKWNEETKILEKLIKQNKFHKFEWLCANEPCNYARFIQILEIVNSCYRVSKDLGQEEDISEFRFIEKYFHKFDIRDAKEGDVLCYKGEVFILKNCVPFDKIVYHCCYDGEYFIPNSIYSLTKDDFNKIHPATKEQSDLLFTKMREAGYEWDAEKKELKKIEQVELPNGEDYGIDSLYHAEKMLEKTLGCVEGYQSDDGILEHKCAIEAVNRLYKQIHNWSEEDEKILYQIQSHLIEFYVDKKGYPYVAEPDSREMIEFNWLKSLKERIKGE